MADPKRVPRILVAMLCSTTWVFAQTKYPVPLVNEPLVPATAAPGLPGFVLTVNGSGFSAQSVVNWNGSARRTAFVNDTQVTARIEAADIATASTAIVTVVNPGLPPRISNPVPFEITTPEQSIQLQVVPTALPAGIPVAADVNGDGIPDLVTWEDNDVLVALGTGGGQFGAAQSYSTALLTIYSVAVGDFYGNGNPDLAVAGVYGVQTLRNKGDGTFVAGPKIAAVITTSLAAGDFNGDGLLDLVAIGDTGLACGGSGCAYVILRNSSKGFAPPVPYAVGSAPVSVVAGDFNRDAALDLAVLNSDDSISVLLGNGDGTFQPQAVYSTGTSADFPTALLAADFNGDGILDLVRSASLYTAATGILLGNGDGTFQPVQIIAESTSGYGVVAGDFNGDGKLDLAVGANGSGAGIMLGNGNGTFQPEQYFSAGSPGSSPAAADFNQNGRLDLALGTEAGLVLLLQ